MRPKRIANTLVYSSLFRIIRVYEYISLPRTKDYRRPSPLLGFAIAVVCRYTGNRDATDRCNREKTENDVMKRSHSKLSRETEKQNFQSDLL